VKKALCKISAALGCAILLTGCAKIRSDVQTRLDAAVADALGGPLASANNRKEFYSYYIDPSVGRLASTATANEFQTGGTRFVMNLDVASIINSVYYPEEAVSHDYALSGGEIASSYGTMKGYNGEELPYEIVIEKTEDGRCLIHVSAGWMSFECLCDEALAPAAAGQMLKISRSVSVDTTAVIAAFTTKEGIDYVGTPVELFEEKAPENGSIEELLVDYNGVPEDKSAANEEGTPSGEEAEEPGEDGE
jgi:hypothetical protein